MRIFKYTWIKLEPRYGAVLGEVCEEASSVAILLNTVVEVIFNDTKVVVCPGMVAEVIFRHWNMSRLREKKVELEWCDGGRYGTKIGQEQEWMDRLSGKRGT